MRLKSLRSLQPAIVLLLVFLQGIAFIIFAFHQASPPPNQITISHPSHTPTDTFPTRRNTKGLTIFAAVLSACKNRDRRDAIRKTWARDPLFLRVHFFIASCTSPALSTAVQQEAAATADVVTVKNITESYYTITHQTLAALTAASFDPAQPSYFLKTDDDTFINPGALRSRLLSITNNGTSHPHHHQQQQQPLSFLFLGNIEMSDRVHRDPKNIWSVTKQDYPRDTYPPWAHGVASLLSMDLVRAIVSSGIAWSVEATMHNGDLFKLEDVALGIWVDEVVKLNNNKEGYKEEGWKVRYVIDERFNYSGCKEGDIASHYMTPETMLCAWASGGKVCACMVDSGNK
jgi:beta-1,3-galactosyltransferase